MGAAAAVTAAARMTTKDVASENPAAQAMSPEKQPEEGRKKTMLVVGIDDSEHSYHALEWTLRRFFCNEAAAAAVAPPYDLVVVYAKPHPNAVVNPSVPGASEVIRSVDADLRKVAAAVVDKIRAICLANSVNALAKVVEGDARETLCAAVKEHRADVLILGSHGYGAIKRALLGSVSEYCARHAQCTVMIVKNPRSKR